MKPRIAVTGMGIMSSIGTNTNEFANALATGKSGIGIMERGTNPPIGGNIGAEISKFSLEELVQRYENHDIPSDFHRFLMMCSFDAPLGVQASVLCSLEAWQQAGLFNKTINSNRLGVVVAGNNLSTNYTYGLLSKYQSMPRYLTPKYAMHFMDTDYVGILSEIFKIQGEGYTTGGASASGNVAIIKACQSLQLGHLDALLVIGALADLSPMELQGFYNLGALGGKQFVNQPEKACRPFDQQHEGFIYGQASGALILENLESAQKRGVTVQAEILGTGMALDSNRLPSPNVEGESRVMHSALEQAGIQPEQIDYINSHGTSSPLGDETEIKAIKNLFKENSSRPWINATKSLTGHCLTAAGVIESIATIIQMTGGFLHPNLNLENPIDTGCTFCPNQAVQKKITHALSNSFGFGGINTSILLKRGD